jgi:hypothetical protein
MEKKLPLFEFIIDDTEESGVKAISIVGDPAFGSSAIFLSKNDSRFIALENKKKQIVAGFSILPNTPVYRVDPEFGEYYGYFSKETIEKIVEKYHQEMLTNKVNLEHNSNAYIDAFMVEDYIVDSELKVQDLAAKGVQHKNALGAWYTAFKIKDKQVFDSIVKSGTGTGFSVEAWLDRILVDFNKQVKNNIMSNKIKREMKRVNKSLKDKILAIFTDEEKFERALVPELAFEIEWTVVGEPVNKVIVDENGEESLQPVGQGEFVTEYGIVVTDESSLLLEVRDLSPEVSEDMRKRGKAKLEEESVEVIYGEIGESVEVEIAGEEKPIEEIVTIDETLELPLETGEVLVIDSGGNLTEIKETPEAPTTEETEIIAEETPIVETPTQGITKSLSEIVGTMDGEYTIAVTVSGGVVVSAELNANADLLLQKQKEVDKLKLENTKLKEKLSEPIVEPIFEPETQEVEWTKLSAYEKLMYKKGLKPFGT